MDQRACPRTHTGCRSTPPVDLHSDAACRARAPRARCQTPACSRHLRRVRTTPTSAWPASSTSTAWSPRRGRSTRCCSGPRSSRAAARARRRCCPRPCRARRTDGFASGGSRQQRAGPSTCPSHSSSRWVWFKAGSAQGQVRVLGAGSARGGFSSRADQFKAGSVQGGSRVLGAEGIIISRLGAQDMSQACVSTACVSSRSKCCQRACPGVREQAQAQQLRLTSRPRSSRSRSLWLEWGGAGGVCLPHWGQGSHMAHPACTHVHPSTSHHLCIHQPPRDCAWSLPAVVHGASLRLCLCLAGWSCL